MTAEIPPTGARIEFPEMKDVEKEHNCPNSWSVQLAGEAASDPANADLYPDGNAQAQVLRMMRAKAIIEKARSYCPGPTEDGSCPFGGPIWDAMTLTHQKAQVLSPVRLATNSNGDEEQHNTGQYL